MSILSAIIGLLLFGFGPPLFFLGMVKLGNRVNPRSQFRPSKALKTTVLVVSLICYVFFLMFAIVLSHWAYGSI